VQQEGKGLGFTIAGGIGSPHVAGDNGIFVSKIIPKSVADVDSRLTVGDRVVSVQGIACQGLSHEVWTETVDVCLRSWLSFGLVDCSKL
jgi:C-terminal processing protease CtpA/Prc